MSQNLRHSQEFEVPDIAEGQNTGTGLTQEDQLEICVRGSRGEVRSPFPDYVGRKLVFLILSDMGSISEGGYWENSEKIW